MPWSTLASIERPGDFDLSSGPAAEADAGPRGLLVQVGDAAVAIPLDVAQEVVAGRALTRLPGAPDAVAGLLNLRGRVVTVVDLQRQRGGGSADGPVVVVEVAGRRFGLRVARVLGVRVLAGEETVDVTALGAATLADA